MKKITLTSLTVMILREKRQLNGFLAGLARREDTSKLRAVVLNMIKVDFSQAPTKLTRLNLPCSAAYVIKLINVYIQPFHIFGAGATIKVR
jgi:hypothetical protein